MLVGRRRRKKELVSWCFEPTQPQRVISGLMGRKKERSRRRRRKKERRRKRRRRRNGWRMPNKQTNNNNDNKTHLWQCQNHWNPIADRQPDNPASFQSIHSRPALLLGELPNLSQTFFTVNVIAQTRPKCQHSWLETAARRDNKIGPIACYTTQYRAEAQSYRDLSAEAGAQRLARRRWSTETCPQKMEQRDLPAEDGEDGEERLGGVGGVGLGWSGGLVERTE